MAVEEEKAEEKQETVVAQAGEEESDCDLAEKRLEKTPHSRKVQKQATSKAIRKEPKSEKKKK